MKKRIKILLIILIPIVLITGGLLMKLGTPLDHFLTHDYTRVTKQDQIDYLKKNEQKMTDYIKKQNSKVTSVQWDWESVEVHRGGGPIVEGISIGISGGFNEIKGSNFALQWPLKNEKSYPKISDMFIVQPLRIGGELYE
ncbi:hypothetical protein [Pseudolactococcus chungangensis]|uniref:hypothetical protein n=1 Tax=Pseudolactococcus chungangensis TaxID=451457 RepID=UPI003FA207E2